MSVFPRRDRESVGNIFKGEAKTTFSKQCQATVEVEYQ